MDTINPLDIPEILTLIANCLTKHHVVICLRVCKFWHFILSPLVWRSVRVGRKPIDFTDEIISRECFMRYSDLIFKLSADYISPDHCSMTFTNLHTVDISKTSFETRNSRDESYAAELISLNPSLTSVHFSRINPDRQFWKALSNLQCLKKVDTIGVGLCGDDMEDFWKVLSKLEEVRLCILSIPTNCKQPSGTFYRLRKISLTADDSDFTVQLQFIRQCPNLEDLFWRVGKESKVLDEFASDIEHGLWRNLETLDLDHCRGDEYSSRILDHILRITKVNARWRQFGPLSFRSLQHHFSTLKKVNCPEATGSMILEMLCSCPLLEDFTAGSLDAKNIENSPPWVCISMKRLHLRFDFDKSEGHLKPLVFKHLSVMINLEAIRIGGLGYYHTPPPIETRLDMRLMKGLGSLSRWKNIRSIDLSETMQSMEEADVRWMISNWRRAEFIHGKLNQDPQINDNLRAMLRERDIK